MTTHDYIEAKRELRRLRELEREAFEERVKAEYAKRRADDKAAGRDTSGKSVSLRQLRAHDTVMMDPGEEVLLIRAEIAEIEKATR